MPLIAAYPVSNRTELGSALASADAAIDIIVTQSFSVTSVVAISAANKAITMTSGAGGPFTLLRGATGNLFTLTGANTTVTLTNIIIDGNKTAAPYATSAGGCLFYVNVAAPVIPDLVIGSGAAIQNNKTTTGNASGVIVNANGWIRLQNGGAVRYNDGGSTGGVYLTGSATVHCRMDIYGGSLGHNTGTSVGGVYAVQSQLHMTGGSVAYNVGVNGGGVYVNTNSTFTMDGGYVEYNSTAGTGAVHGGGVDLSAAGAYFVMNGGFIQYNSSPFGGGVSIHANVADTIQINAGTITGNESTGAGAVGAGILFYAGGTNVTCNVYIGVTPGGVPTAGPVIISNNQALDGTAGGIGATKASSPAVTLPTANELLTYYWPHLFVGPNVYFSGNQSSEGRDISGNACTAENCSSDVSAPIELLCTQFRSLSATHIQATNFTAPFTYGYNDFDIQMPIGCTVAAVVVTFHFPGGSLYTHIIPQGGTVPNPTPVDGCNQSFTFWYEDPALTIPWDFETEIYSSIDLYGLDIYIPCTYRHVVFFSNGGSAVPTQSVVTGSEAAEPRPPVRGCDQFAGWFIDPALTIPYTFSSPVGETIILYAKWIPA